MMFSHLSFIRKMDDEVLGSDGDYWRKFVEGFTKFMSDRPEQVSLKIDKEHEVYLINIFDGSSEERTSPYPCEHIGSFLKKLGTRRVFSKAKEILNGCRIDIQRGTKNKTRIHFHESSSILSTLANTIPQSDLDFMDGVNISPVSASAIEEEQIQDDTTLVTFCHGYWQSIALDMHHGDIRVVAGHLKSDQSFDFCKLGIALKRVDDPSRPFELHSTNCNGNIVGKGHKFFESEVRRYCCDHCNRKRTSSSYRDNVSKLEKIKSDLEGDVFSKFLVKDGVFTSDNSIRALSRIDLISLILGYFKGIFLFLLIFIVIR
jgi:hypothetical protein